MNENAIQRVITLKDLWGVFARRSLVIILVTLVVAGGYHISQKLNYVPMYKSTATLYIAGNEETLGNSSAEAYNNFSLALKVVNDCTYFLSSRSVVEQVIEELGLPMSYESLAGRISTNNPLNTRILEVSVQADTPERAKQIVDRLCELGRDKIHDAMGMGHVTLYEYGTLTRSPSNAMTSSMTLVVAGAAMAVTYSIFLMIFLLDDRIRDDDDLEQLLGLSVLGDIPDRHHSGRGYYGYYRRYGYAPYGARNSKKK